MNTEDIKAAVLQVMLQATPVDLSNKIAFLKNGIFLYHVIRASEDLLNLAAYMTSEGPLQKYFLDHLEEERGHAAWLAEDLKTAGVNVKFTDVPIEAVQMVGSVMYLVSYVSSVAQLGYMLTLECFPKSLSAIEHLEKMHGKELMRTARYHAENDVDHGADLTAVIDTLAEEQKKVVYETAVQTARYIASASRSFR